MIGKWKACYPRTRIVATIGPATRERGKICDMIAAGASVFRINLSHGTRQEHEQTFRAVRAVARAMGSQPAILLDLQGPRIRTGATLGDAPVHVVGGTVVELMAGAGPCDERRITISYSRLFHEIRSGQIILINDGLIRLELLDVDAGRRRGRAKVLSGGWYTSRKGVNLPGARLTIPALSAKDKRDLRALLPLEPDFVALSFVRSAADLRLLQRWLAREKEPARVIAKIETPEAVEDIEAILGACDGIMVARGDLGVEVEPENVPMIQKDLIAAANRAGRIVIVATQMLESMVHAPRPTRAEASDVANAILDGADAVMLSAETSIGEYPVEAIRMMAAIDWRVSQWPQMDGGFRDLRPQPHRPFHALCEAAVWASRDLGHAPIVVFTISGDTALYLSKLRPPAPIWAFTPEPRTERRLSIAWNTRAFPIAFERNVGRLRESAQKLLLRSGLV
ncbi:MAG: pyruvate kinase, partial [Kiritimatiellia bacterium]